MSDTTASVPGLVSLVIPINGRAALFAPAADSLLAQTHPQWEALVVDDGSPAGEFERIRAIAARDPRFRLLRNAGPRRGASACRNQGFAAARGEFVIFFDSDDLLDPGCLRGRVAALHRAPDADAVVFRTRIFEHVPGDTGRLWNVFTAEDDLDRFLRVDTTWQTMGPMWRRTSLLRFQPLWDEAALSWQDWEFHIRLLAAGLRIVKCTEPDSSWRAPSAAGSIGRQHHARRSVFNRVRLFGRLAAELRRQNALTPYRRRILATLLFQHAFRYGQIRPRAMLLWRWGRRQRLIGPCEHLAVVALELLRRGCEKLEHRLYPIFIGIPKPD